MGCRRWFWHRNISPWDSHVHTAMQVVRLKIDLAGGLLFCLLVCLSLALTSLCTYFCSSITPFLFPTFFFLLFRLHLNEAMCHKYASIVYGAYFNTYVGFHPEREVVSAISSKIFLNMLQPDIYSMILGTNISISFCFDLHVIYWKILDETDKEREGSTGAAHGVIAHISHLPED